MKDDSVKSDKNVSSHENKTNIDELKKELDLLKKQNDELRSYKDDMLKYKSEKVELEEQVKKRELAEQEAKGNFQSVIETLKAENETMKKLQAEERAKFAQSRVEHEVKTEALSRGCKDAETFYKLINKEELGSVELDESMQVSKDLVKQVVDKASKQYEHLGFFKKDVSIVDGLPAKPRGVKQSRNDVWRQDLIKLRDSIK